jgi:DNA-binding NtrC family response regulator
MKNEFEGLAFRLLAGNITLEDAVKLLERSMIEGALAGSRGNQSAASKQLGIHRNTLQRKMVEYDLSTRRPRARRKPAARELPSRRKKAGTA